MELHIENLSKTYQNQVKALVDIHLEIKAGMFGLLGPNGAGKSSLMRTIATLQLPDQGQILFNGENIFTEKMAFRKVLGFLPQEFGVYPKESAYSLLDYFSILKGISSKKERSIAIERVLELTNLLDAQKQRVSTFSGGMRQRFGIAQLLLNQPKVIIVDEPTAGLDPAERTRFLNVLRNIGSENIVLFSTHLVEDVRALCHDLAIINEGKLLSKINPKEAVRQLEGKIFTTSQPVNESENERIRLSEHFTDSNQRRYRVFSPKPSEDLKPVTPNLEDYYFLTLNQSR